MQKSMGTPDATSTIKQWVELYSDNMYSWALHKTSNKETAEDLVQETFLAAVQSFEKFVGKSKAKTWLFAILNNKINDHYREIYRKPFVDNNKNFEELFDHNDHWRNESKPLEWTKETSQFLDDPDFNNVLSDCLKKLPENWFSAIQLKFLEEKKGELICQELGISDTNFWQILHRAKLQLRKCLEVDWFNK